MAANLDVGTQVPASITPQGQGLGNKWCYNNLAANCATYGGLYQWATVVQIPDTFNNNLYGTQLWMTCDPCGSNGRQGICPPGFHIPTDLEWSRYEWCIDTTISPTGNYSLSNFQTIVWWRGSSSSAGSGAKMKATSPAWDGTNASGFSALPGGYSANVNTLFYGQGFTIRFWTATESGSAGTWFRELYTGAAQSFRGSTFKVFGFSVRCLQN
jgi:uncharacterized protein (TIGR02145 family)